MMATHEQINKVINQLAWAGVSGRRLEVLSRTARQWQQAGLDAQAIAHLLPCVPVK